MFSRAHDRFRSLSFFPFLVLLLVSSPSPAAGFTLADSHGIGVRTMGMGGAFTAVADDPSANYYNPAGLIQMNNHHAQVEYMMVFPRVYLQQGSGPRQTYLDKTIKAPMLGLVLDISRYWAIPRKVRVGFSGYFPQNFKSAGQIRYGTFYDPYYPRYGDSSVNQTLSAWINMAVEVFPWLYVGGGFLFGTHASDVTLRMAIDPRTLQLVIERSRVKWAMTTEVSPMAGVLVKPTRNLRIGFAFREGMELLFANGLKVEADLYLGPDNVVPAPIPGFPLVVPINAHYRPLQYALGASYRLLPLLLLAFDITYYDWRAYEDESEQSPNPRMNEVWVPRFGVEYVPFPSMALRAGYGYNPSPLEQQTGTWVNYLDNDVHMFSCGLGVAWDVFGRLPHPLAFSFCYQFGYLVPRTFLNVHSGAPPLRSSGYIQSVSFGLKLVF